MSQQTPQRPVETIRIRGGIEVAIWENQVERDGRVTTRHSVTHKKRYYDQQSGEFRDSSTLFPEDLPRLGLGLRKAFEYIMLKGDHDPQDDAKHDD